MSKINDLRAQRAKTWEQTKAFLDSHRKSLTRKPPNDNIAIWNIFC